jgi:hypothetical protein
MLALKQISDIELLKADVPLYYMTNYNAKAFFTDDNNNDQQFDITFSLEMEATGFKKVEVQFKQDIDYPLLPLIKMLKEEVSRLDKEGKLPW